MATFDEIIVAIEKFELDIVEKQWSDNVWANDFSICPDDLPAEFADKFSPLSYCQIVEVIENADNIISEWMTENLNGSSSSNNPEHTHIATSISWTALQDIDYKKLLAILYYYICKGQAQNQEFNSVLTCLKATNFYYTLLMIPGSDIYKVFNLSLFEKCLETFSLHKYLEIATGRKIKRTKNKKNDEVTNEEEYLDIDETLSLSQQENIVRQLNFLLSTFQVLVSKFNFKKYPEAVNMSLSQLADLTRIERNSTLQDYYSNNDHNSLAPLSRNAYLTMKAFCSNQHGRVAENVRLVLYYIMPNLTSIGGSAIPEFNKYNPRELNNVRNVAVSFVTDNIIPMGNDANLGLKILIQQICFNMVDRADYRPKATEMILTILSKLSLNLYYAIVMWIFRLSMMEGAHHRVIGVELLSKLLYMRGPGTVELSVMTESQARHSQIAASACNNLDDPSLSNFRSELNPSVSQAALVSFAHPINHEPIAYRRAMLAIIIDRIRDEAAIVRTRALTVIGELLSNKTSQTVRFLLEEIFINPYIGEGVINDENEGNEFLKWKNFVAALDKVREKETTRNMIPSGKAIINKIFEKCLDERVSVRKAALQVIMKVFKFSSKWMTNENLELFGRHCRDPALSIRKDMVSCVTELMLHFPVNNPLIKLWVKEVVPQITDREIRVQEQVLQVFTTTIISRIVPYENTKTEVDKLPWRLLDCIGRMKMRSFLITACSLWQKSGYLTQSLIRKIVTHINTRNDCSSWLLISSISEFMDIDSPLFVHTYYFNNVSKMVGNVGVLNLSLITLNNCWQKLDLRDQISLQKEICANIESYSVPSSLMSKTIEIAAAITIALSENELEGKKKIADWAGKRIQESETHLEECFGSSASHRCDKCFTILSLLGNISTFFPNKITNSTFTMLHNFLMDPANQRGEYNHKMRAILVLTLSKMALKNDSFARTLVSSLSELLTTATDPILLNNVIVSIADIGERYANLIEPLISSMCVCLKSKHKVVKEITLILLIELLQEDYLKARGALVFHLLTLVNDTDPKAVNIVKYYFTNCLIARHPYKMYELLLPSIFHFNNYTKHPDYPELEMDDSEKFAFDISGEINHRKRMNIYQFMLSNIPDMVRMKCLHFICTVVLNGAADSIISIKKGNGEQVVHDALSVLLTKEIKIDYNELVKKKNEDGEEEDDEGQNPLYKLGKQMFSAAQKKEIIDTIIPICCKFKKKLLQENRKLLPLLRKFVRELVRDYKDEITELFKEDKQFGLEILHEIENAENRSGADDDEESGEIQTEGAVNPTEVVSLPENANEVPNCEKPPNPDYEVDMSNKQFNALAENGKNVISDELTNAENMSRHPIRDVDIELEKCPEPELANIDKIKEANCTKELVVCIERLSLKDYGLAEDDQRDEVKEAVEEITKQEEALKRLSITLERLSSKYINFIDGDKKGSSSNKKKSSKQNNEIKIENCSVRLERLDEKLLKNLKIASNEKFEDAEEVLKKGAAKVVMPQSKTNAKHYKKPESGFKSNGIGTPALRGDKPYPMTSTPMLNLDKNPFSADNISPVIDSEDKIRGQEDREEREND